MFKELYLRIVVLINNVLIFKLTKDISQKISIHKSVLKAVSFEKYDLGPIYAVHAIEKTVNLCSHGLNFIHIKFSMVCLH